MLQHNYGTEKINRLHTEATNARIANEAKPHMLRRNLTKALNYIANRLDSIDIDNDTDGSFNKKATA